MLEESMKEKLLCVNQKISSFLQPIALCLISYHRFHIPVSIVLILSFSWTDENKLINLNYVCVVFKRQAQNALYS